ncbi:transmembrane protein 53-like [Lolium rigidum]|uniref:transmembrane protein 53-like n=1 Tax=Lolium rigidum TaxID=89674 RepID=UPI001F5C8C8E|nr:transmembrane protein 53-like [Lolium rigidum]
MAKFTAYGAGTAKAHVQPHHLTAHTAHQQIPRRKPLSMTGRAHRRPHLLPTMRVPLNRPLVVFSSSPSPLPQQSRAMAMAACSVRLLAAAHRRSVVYRHARRPVACCLSFPRSPGGGSGPSFRGRASLSSISLPSSSAAAAPFSLLPPDSDPFIQWDPPPPQDTSSGSPFGAGRGGEEGPALVVLLGWLGARQKHLRRYADLYRDRGVGSVRFVVPVRDLVGLDLGRRVELRVADLSAEIAAWCDADRRRTLLFHTFSNTGWLAYGAVLENLQSRADIIERIRGCIVDSAPVLEIRPEVWAAGFSAAMLKKSSTLTGPSADCPDGSTLNGALNKVNSVSDLTKPSWGETFLLSTLHKFFEIVLHVPDVNQRLRKVLAVLSEKQPSCPQFYLYSTADRVIPAECVESFISTQRSLGLSVSAHNFVSSPHVDHYRSFPHLYSAKIDEFLKICSPARV